MEKPTPKEQEAILLKLREKYNTQKVEHHGYNLYVIHFSYEKNIDGRIVWFDKDTLVDKEGNIITLDNEYNSIFMFSAGVAVVCIRDIFTQDKKNGLIDINGKELLPCIYDSISVHIDGHIDITLGWQKKWTNVDVVASGKFNWDEAID